MRTPRWTWLVALLAVGALISGSLTCAVVAPKLFRDFVLFRMDDFERDFPLGVALLALPLGLFISVLIQKTLAGRHKGYTSLGWPLPDAHGPPRGRAAPRLSGRRSAPDNDSRRSARTSNRELG